MRRIAHGSTSPLEPPEDDGSNHGLVNPGLNCIAPHAPAQTAGTPFGYLFPDLAETEAALLPQSSETLDNLARLGDAMCESPRTSGSFSRIHSVYTYFGQFLDHDITFTNVPKTPRDLTDSCMLGDSLLRPWDVACIKAHVTNRRARILELDTVYGGKTEPPKDEGDPRLLKLGRVTPVEHNIQVKDEYHDLPRGGVSDKRARDRVAAIGDPRNDQSLLISQLHVAFLRAHNAIVRREKCSFDDAREMLRQHYHWIIIHDFLKKITAEGTVEAVLSDPDPLYNVGAKDFFLPLEFTVAAFRFGHSMIRDVYYLNSLYPSQDLALLFTLRALREHPTLPGDSIIEWRVFLPGFDNRNTGRLIDTRLIDPLRAVLDEAERPMPCETRLAVLDLKRGYMMRIPTGQAVAKRLGAHVMTAAEIEEAVADERQIRVLRDSGFLERTPLWFYILAEAASHFGDGGHRLGPVGSRLVAEVLVGLVRRSQPSILSKTEPPWTPKLPGKMEGQFDLADLLRLAGVLN